MSDIGEIAQQVPPKKAHSTRNAVLRGLLSLAVVGVIFFGVFPQIADFSEVWVQIKSMTPLESSTVTLAALWNLLTYLFVLVPCSPGLTYPKAFVVTQSTTAAANTFPAGAAVGIGMTYAMYTSWGFARAVAARAILVSGVWNNFAKLGLPVLALVLLAIQGSASFARVMAGLFGIGALLGSIAIFALMLRSDRLAQRMGDGAARLVSRIRGVFRRPPVTGWGDAARAFRADTIDLLRDAWLRLTVGAIVSQLSLYLLLLLVLRDLGVSEREVGWVEVLASFAFVRLLTALPVTPGGVGVVELGLTAALVSAGGDRDSVVAAVLVFRALTYLLPIPVGVVTYVIWRRRKSWRKPIPGEEPAVRP
ncbi:MAG: lysylphosphatidylglycerol synthase transmembrane domain-containing protein [Acidimicrobiales bacterium]